MPQETTTSPIGRDTPRVDGPLKVTGTAQYASDFNFPGLLYAVPVEATIASGKITKLDTAAAEKMPGVRAILHRQNIGKIFRSTLGQGMNGICIERRPPFEDDVVRYYGRDARSHRAPGNDCNVGRRQADDLRGIASRLQHARRARANVWFT